METKTTQIIPIELAAFIFKNKLSKPFAVYMYIKFFSPGQISEGSDNFKLLGKVLGFKSHNTTNKYLRQAFQLGWLGYDILKGIYHIRSIHYVCHKLDLNTNLSAVFNVENLNALKTFLAATIVCEHIRKHKSYFKYLKCYKFSAATKKPGIALQAVTFDIENRSWAPKKSMDPPAYFGLSNLRISKELGCSKTAAVELKKSMVKYKFIYTIPHRKVIKMLKERDYNIRAQYYEQFPEERGKISFEKVQRISNGVKTNEINMILFQHDEIIPLIRFSKSKKV